MFKYPGQNSTTICLQATVRPWKGFQMPTDTPRFTQLF